MERNQIRNVANIERGDLRLGTFKTWKLFFKMADILFNKQGVPLLASGEVPGATTGVPLIGEINRFAKTG